MKFNEKMKMSRSLPWGYLAIPMVAITLAMGGCGQSRQTTAKSQAALTGSNVLTVSYIDVGQGDSALLQTPSGKNILIDSGPAAGRKSLFNYLKKQNVTSLDLIVATHPHEDHIANLPGLLKAMPVTTFVDSGFVTGSPRQESLLRAIKANGCKFENVGKQGLVGSIRDLGDGISMQILQPQMPYLNGTESDPNNNSVVVKITDGKVRFLFTGDEEEEERARLYKTGYDLRADILKAAHHGSRNGTDDEFLQRVKPTDAIISCGVNNSYGHPHQEALAALAKNGVHVWRTDEQGTIVVTTNGTKYAVTSLGKGPDAPPPGHGKPKRRRKSQ